MAPLLNPQVKQSNQCSSLFDLFILTFKQIKQEIFLSLVNFFFYKMFECLESCVLNHVKNV